MEVHPADVLGYAMEMQLAEGGPGIFRPAVSLQESSEMKQLPWAEAAQVPGTC